jgi:AcrR family transcriptional regulator
MATRTGISMPNDTESTPRRGRPPAYDRDAAIAALTNEFWRGGYDGTSLDDLSRATGMGRPSLYAAFGDKAAMYALALDHYLALLERETARVMAREARLVDALMAGFGAALALFGAGLPGNRGCFLLCTLPAVAGADAAAARRLGAALARFDCLFLPVLTRARDAGQLPADADLAGKAQQLATALHSLALRARADTPRDALLGLAVQAVIRLV